MRGARALNPKHHKYASQSPSRAEGGHDADDEDAVRPGSAVPLREDTASSRLDDTFGIDRGDANPSKYLDRVAARSEALLERRTVADVKERERRRHLGLEPRTHALLLVSPTEAEDKNSPQALLQQLERGAKKDLTVTVPSTNEVRVYRRARTEGKAAQRSMAHVRVDNELLATAGQKHKEYARARNAAPGSLSEARDGHLPNVTAIGTPLPANTVRRPCELDKVLALSDADYHSGLSKEQWSVWVTERQAVAAVDPNAGKKQRRRVRHHRRSCKYHLYSTHRGFRQLSLQTTFPHTAMHESLDRLRHMRHGAANGASRLDFNVEDFFAPMTVGWWGTDDSGFPGASGSRRGSVGARRKSQSSRGGRRGSQQSQRHLTAHPSMHASGGDGASSGDSARRGSRRPSREVRRSPSMPVISTAGGHTGTPIDGSFTPADSRADDDATERTDATSDDEEDDEMSGTMTTGGGHTPASTTFTQSAISASPGDTPATHPPSMPMPHLEEPTVTTAEGDVGAHGLAGASALGGPGRSPSPAGHSRASRPSVTVTNAHETNASAGTAFLTETGHADTLPIFVEAPAGRGAVPAGGRPGSRMSERCKTPDVSRFAPHERPHTATGEYHDCSCTDRSTDDELERVPDRYGPEEASAAAADRLECWRRGFAKTKVLARSRLESRLVERRDERAALCDDRRHFSALTQDAERQGREWRVNRQTRLTTPAGSSMWHTHFESMGRDAEQLLASRDAYVALCDACAGVKFPAAAEDEGIAEEVRQRFMQGKGLSAAFVLDLMARHAKTLLARKPAVRFLDVLRQHAAVPTTDFLQALQSHTARIQREAKQLADRHRRQQGTLGTADAAATEGTRRPIAHEVENLTKRLQKLLAGGSAAAAGSAAASHHASASTGPL